MTVASYLERNPQLYPIEPQAPTAAHAVVIPVFDENAALFRTLASLKKALTQAPEPIIVLLVLNEPAVCRPEAAAANRELLHSLKKNDGKYDGGLELGRELFYINLLDKDIKPKFRTVGNARKAGFDGIIHQSDGKVTDKKQWLFSLDADTLVSADYFVAAMQWIKANDQAAGAVFHFEHRFESPDKAVNAAAMRYEIYLRDYVRKLRNCGSAYGFWTIGSAFMCNAADYMRCGGMRRHPAGEDFYFLQALRKVAPVGVVPGGCVYPAGRLSDRVPFGTGPAIAGELAGRKVELYAQADFDELARFFQNILQSDYAQLSSDLMQLAPELLREFFRIQNFEDIWGRIVQNTPRNSQALQRALHIYCDSFFVLKFCHWLEAEYPERFAREVMSELAYDELFQTLNDMRLQDRADYC